MQATFLVLSHLSYIPFIEPIEAVHTWWYLLLIPLSFGISMIYKAMRVHDFGEYWRQVIVMTVQIILAMLILAIGLVILVEWLIPRLHVQ